MIESVRWLQTDDMFVKLQWLDADGVWRDVETVGDESGPPRRISVNTPDDQEPI